MRFAVLEKDPFRIFFPLGACLAIIGVIPWAFQIFGGSAYPRDFHQALMVNGFLLSFICGFLMTAVPRFTGTHYATRTEISSILAGILSSSVAVLLNYSFSFLLSAATIVLLAIYGGRRFFKRTSNPPYTFLFVGIGMFFWFVGNLGEFVILSGALEMDRSVFQDLYSNGAIMSFILGVGGRLIPAILGWQDVVSSQKDKYENNKNFLTVVPWEIWFFAVTYVLSFVLGVWLPDRLCLILRAATVLFFAFKYWKILKLPKTRSYLSWSIWLSSWCLASGYPLAALWPNIRVHVFHILLIGGFSLLTLIISTRVTFAHGSQGVAAEKTTPNILIFSLVILFAMLTRATAIVWPQVYLHHLAYAAITWILGLLTWAWVVRGVLKPPKN